MNQTENALAPASSIGGKSKLNCVAEPDEAVLVVEQVMRKMKGIGGILAGHGNDSIRSANE